MSEVAASLSARCCCSGREGPDRPGSDWREGVPAGSVSLPGHAPGHRAPLSRAIKFRDRRMAEISERLICRFRAEVDRPREGGRADGPASRDRLKRSRCSTRSPSIGSMPVWRGPPRRGARSGEGAHFSFREDFGEWDPKAHRSCGTCTTAYPPAHVGLPSWRCDAVSLLRAWRHHRRSSPTVGRRSAGTGCFTQMVPFVEPWVLAVVATPRRSRDFLTCPPAVVE